MIPKRIHYCWFGGREKPEEVKKCIASWKKYCPDYELVEWNESKFDVNIVRYTREAFEAKRWAFIADYARLYALFHYGGIYVDTDVEVLKPLDGFLDKGGFAGFEREDAISTGIIAFEKGNRIVKAFLDSYNDRSFYLANGEADVTTNVTAFTNMLLKKGLKLNNKKQVVEGMTLYPREYFSPKNYYTGKIELTKNTHTIHHFAGTWKTESELKKDRKKNAYITKYGKKAGTVLFVPQYIAWGIKEYGLKHFCGIVKNKLLKNRG